MKMKVSDYISNFLVESGIYDVFSVVGGGAMHLNDSIGHNPNLNVVYCHNEQTCSMAADAYAKEKNFPAIVCVTTGPGATNAITGVAGAWVDSSPMIILSGQVRYDTTVQHSKLVLRARGIQEFDILGSVSNMTKYCEMVTNPLDISYCLEKAVYFAKSGRPGPCWLDIPLNVQGAMIETNDLNHFIEPPGEFFSLDDSSLDAIVHRLEISQRPLLFVGNGVRLSGAHDLFIKLVNKLKIPVVTGMSSIDAISSDCKYYVGRTGIQGDRAGNFAIQTCDLLISLGSRLSYTQTGFNYKLWAPEAYKIVNDIDSEELRKDSIGADLSIPCDVAILMEKLLDANISLPDISIWCDKCTHWKTNYPVVTKKHYSSLMPNIYSFFKEMTSKLDEDSTIVVSVGMSRVAGSQAAIIKKNTRFITNVSMASMGYCLPAAIGVCVSRNMEKVILVTGEGSLQMNIQELQTISHHKYPICIFVINNQGYQSIRTTQNNYFGGKLVGVGPDSGDLSFPDLSKISVAYEIPYFSCHCQADLMSVLDSVLCSSGPVICEIFVSPEQIVEPRVANKVLPDGSIVSGTFSDMFPFLDEKVLRDELDYKNW